MKVQSWVVARVKRMRCMPPAIRKRPRTCFPMLRTPPADTASARTPAVFATRIFLLRSLALAIQAITARDRARQTIEIARRHEWILFIGLDTLTLARADHALASQSLPARSSPQAATVDARAADVKFNQAIEGLCASGHNDYLPRGLLARAAFRRAAGDWDRAARDLNEAQEIAEPEPMRLYLCDCALERARLALAEVRGLCAARWPRRAEPAAARFAQR